MGMSVGKNFKRLHGVILDPAHCWLIAIGDNVTMAPGVHILAHDASTFLHLGYTIIGRVNIGNNVFIGAQTVVLPNVTIGDNVIIGANSTVTQDVPASGVYAGNPVKCICGIDEFIEKNRKMLNIRPCYDGNYTLRKNIDTAKKMQMKHDLMDGPGFIV
jgi:maltose O-acetyltransferase